MQPTRTGALVPLAAILVAVFCATISTASQAPENAKPTPRAGSSEPSDSNVSSSEPDAASPSIVQPPGQTRSQPPAPPSTAPRPVRRSPSSARPSRSASRRRSLVRLARAPDMFGDFFGVGEIGAASGAIVAPFINSSLPLAGGGRILKVSENNKALPADRVFFQYNHFHNALHLQRFGGGPLISSQQSAVDRYMIGWEKTLLDGCWSVELRMPLSSDFEATQPDAQFEGGNVGNLSVLVKRLLYRADRLAVAGGMGISTPTGSDVRGALPLVGTTFTVHNQATHLQPYLGFLATPLDDVFLHGFAQIDVPANGNSISVTEIGGSSTGELNDQTRLYLDLSAGTWLLQRPGCRGLTGLATVLEFHYTTTTSDADTVFSPGGTVNFFGSLPNRYDVVNLTAGLHLELGRVSALRVGGVFPLDDDERFFDSELMVSWNRRF